jgi:hypothetical protein
MPGRKKRNSVVAVGSRTSGDYHLSALSIFTKGPLFILLFFGHFVYTQRTK